jgi:hypothetical protein
MNYTEAKTSLADALNSEDPWERYWGLIVCSRFAGEAKEMLPTIEKLAQSDAELINRVRAAEYMGITGSGDPVKRITETLYESNDAVEALLILNTAVMLQDGHGYTFRFSLEKIRDVVKNEAQVQRRLEYFNVIGS